MLGVPDEESLRLDHVVVSHLDLDHVSGIVQLFRDLRDQRNEGQLVPFAVQRLWHNSFSDSLSELTQNPVMPASLVAAVDEAEVVAAGVADARELRDIAEFFGIEATRPSMGSSWDPDASSSGRVSL